MSSLEPRKIEVLCKKSIGSLSYGSGPHVLAVTGGTILSLFDSSVKELRHEGILKPTALISSQRVKVQIGPLFFLPLVYPATLMKKSWNLLFQLENSTPGDTMDTAS